MKILSHSILYLTSLLLIFSCQPKPVERPNIVWISSEDNSKHYMSLFDEHGVETPHIESLAQHGVVFNNAFSNAAVCSAARSTLISGCYGPRLASHYHRKIEKVPMPLGLEMFPAYLKQAGYYTTNNAKEDYNFFKSDSVWDASSKKADWSNRKDGQPFFHVYNIGTSHEGCLHFDEEKMKTHTTSTDPESCFVQPNHPQTDLFRYTAAYYRDKIQEMDQQVGEQINRLKEAGLLESTFVFYFGDHGGVLPGSKGYLAETGLHVPLVVHIPEKYKHLVDVKPGSRSNGFISFVDFGATVLNLAGISVPSQMDGLAFMGPNVSCNDLEERNETYSYADRFDEKYDMVRAIRRGNYKYVRNYQPFNFDGLMNNYRYKQLAYKQWKEEFGAGKLNEIQSYFYQAKAPEGLYDVVNDPYETNNLADNPEYNDKLLELRTALQSQGKNMPDLSFYPEYLLIQTAFDNPVEFGQNNKANIAKYIDIADLSLLPIDLAMDKLLIALESNDATERYWALNASLSFGDSALDLTELITAISEKDEALINRVRAAEFLAITQAIGPEKTITQALYASEDAAESLLILNSIVLMQDGHGFSFDLDIENLPPVVKSNKLVLERFKYLKPIKPEA